MTRYFLGDDDGSAGYPSGFTGSSGFSGQAVGGSFNPRAILPGNPGKPNDVDGDFITLSLTPNRDLLPSNHPHQLLSDNELWGVQLDRRIPYWRNLNTGEMVYDHPGRPALTGLAQQGFTTMPGIVGIGNVMRATGQAGENAQENSYGQGGTTARPLGQPASAPDETAENCLAKAEATYSACIRNAAERSGGVVSPQEQQRCRDEFNENRARCRKIPVGPGVIPDL